jgi:hypothetical protein
LWHRADTRHLVTCVADATRRERYASLITRVNFYDHEFFLARPINSQPQVPAG